MAMMTFKNWTSQTREVMIYHSWSIIELAALMMTANALLLLKLELLEYSTVIRKD
jgi:hypothetical protein